MIIPGTEPVPFTLNASHRKKVLEEWKVKWNFPGLSEFVFARTYSRVKEDGTQENWNEVVLRVIEGMFTILKTHCKRNGLDWDERKAQKLAIEAAERMFVFKWLPPGRGLWMMGTPFMWKWGGGALNNCGFISTSGFDKNDPSSVTKTFYWHMNASMLGVGVGFDVKGADKKIKIRGCFGHGAETFVVPDTREGWCEALEKTLHNHIFGGPEIELDTRLVRKKGEPIKGFGGTASGPEALIIGIRGIIDIMSKKEYLDEELITDIFNMIGKIVVAGNVRRTAEIGIARASDKLFAQLKNDPVAMGNMPPQELIDLQEVNEVGNVIGDPSKTYWDIIDTLIEKYKNEPWAYKIGGWRWASNNSILGETVINFNDYDGTIRTNGEPGFFWLDLAREYGRLKDPANHLDYRAMGTNPCVSGNTRLLTSEGYFPIREIVGKEVEIWNGYEWSKVTPFSTGVNPLMKVTLSNGAVLNCTPYHKWQLKNGERVETKDLVTGDKLFKVSMPVLDLDPPNDPIIDAYSQGFYQADGTTGETGSLIYFPKFVCIPRLIGTVNEKVYKGNRRGWTHGQMKPKGFVPHNASIEYKVNWLAGLFDGDGSIGNNPNSTAIQLTSIDLKFLRELRLLLTTLGVQAHIEVNNNEGKMWGKYKCLPCHRICINSMGVKNLVDLGMKCERLDLSKISPNRDASRFVKIVSVESLDSEEETYCVTEPKRGLATFDGIVTGNCGEQTLESYELCCLVENFPSFATDYWDFQRTLKFSYLYAKAVTLIATEWHQTNAIISRNRRIGASLSGIYDAVEKIGRKEFFRNWADNGYDYLKYVDRKYSDWLGVRPSIKISSVKPSGTVSLVAGVYGPGANPPKMKSGYRLIRIVNQSPLLKKYKDANYRIEPDIKDPMNTSVIYFPWLAPEGLKTEEESTVWSQLKMVSDLQYWWADNQVSNTIMFDKHEDIIGALEAFEGQVKAVAFLPKMDAQYKQMPFTKAPREEIEEYLKTLKEVTITEGSGENAESNKFCDGDSCSIF